MYQAVLFDLDGTLINSNAAILSCFQRVLAELQLKNPGDEVISAEFGKPLEYFIEYLHIPTEKIDAFVDGVQSCVHNISAQYFSGVPELLQQLHAAHVPLAIITSKARKATLLNIKQLHLDKYFAVILSAQDVEHPKPAPDPLLKAINLLGLMPNHAIAYVGDTINDMLAAKAAGISAVGVGWGLHHVKLLAESNYYVKTIEELQNHLLSI